MNAVSPAKPTTSAGGVVVVVVDVVVGGVVVVVLAMVVDPTGEAAVVSAGFAAWASAGKESWSGEQPTRTTSASPIRIRADLVADRDDSGEVARGTEGMADSIVPNGTPDRFALVSTVPLGFSQFRTGSALDPLGEFWKAEYIMRFARLAAFTLWLAVALLAVAGFAAFSPGSATNITTTTTIAAPLSAGADWGSTSGRMVAFAFSSGLRSMPRLADQTVEDALIADILGDRPQVSTPTTVADVQQVPTTALPPAPSPPTTAPPAPTAPPNPEPPSEDGVRGIIALFFDPEDVDLALEVSYCESRWDPEATNPSSGAAGLFQHLPRFWAERSVAAGWGGANIYDPHANVAVSAWLVYEGGGWAHWAESQGCWG